MNYRQLSQRGFTLIELMVVTAIVGILSAIAIPSFIKYIKKSKSTEARTQLSKIYNGARTYYYEDIAASTQIDVVNPQFPADNPKTPAVSCCSATGERCSPDDSLWQTPTWEALKFGIPDPHYYQYRFESEGEGIDANFTAMAYGDLDCDGEFSTFLMWGMIDDVGGDPVLSAAASRKNELE